MADIDDIDTENHRPRYLNDAVDIGFYDCQA